MLSGAQHTRELFLCLEVDGIFFEDGLSEIFCLRLLYAWIPRSLNGQPRDPIRHFEESGQWINRPWISYLCLLYSIFLWASTRVIKTRSDSFAQLWDRGCRKWIMLVFVQKLYTFFSCKTCFHATLSSVAHWWMKLYVFSTITKVWVAFINVACVSCSDLDRIGIPVVCMWGVVEGHVLWIY